jgi:hypothetical protein
MGGQTEGVDQVSEDQADVSFGFNQAFSVGRLLSLLAECRKRCDNLHARVGCCLKHEDLLVALERDPLLTG